MLNIIKKRIPNEREKEIEELKAELKRCRFLMYRNEVIFNMTENENLISAQIYEREALRCQYCYLLEQVRLKEGNIADKNEVLIGEV